MDFELRFSRSLERKNSLEEDLSEPTSSWLYFKCFRRAEVFRKMRLPFLKCKEHLCLCCSFLIGTPRGFSSWFAWYFKLLVLLFFHIEISSDCQGAANQRRAVWHTCSSLLLLPPAPAPSFWHCGSYKGTPQNACVLCRMCCPLPSAGSAHP